ncbi:TetR family transcriptional regulator [Microterricola gilva]|uniref:TetR family transcriptional regulator n=1 Tax=Microterricola gilva TaxID=393267 RepID=A0A4Q8AQD0_9MICO|nr:TetR/AcrR family transcriptional regulator [Microterricola gilva]RZU66932.1 TetR family transcriptional regulator [Microterricola gilva]
MGRTQAFDTATAVAAARDVFWDKGFEAASLADLEEATGLNRSSLYRAFESKRGLYDAAVADYLDTVIAPRLARLRDAEDPAAALREYWATLSAFITMTPPDSPRRGCLLLNSASGIAGYDEQQRAVVDGYRASLQRAFESALGPADAGLPAEEVERRARLFVAITASALLLSRVNPGEAAALIATAATVGG